MDYPSNRRNSLEDLSVSRGIEYIRKKEVIFEIGLDEIKKVIKNEKGYEIYISEDDYILINDMVIVQKLYEYLK